MADIPNYLLASPETAPHKSSSQVWELKLCWKCNFLQNFVVRVALKASELIIHSTYHNVYFHCY